MFDYTHAIVRRPAASVVSGLRAGDGPDPDYAALFAEHEAYVSALRGLGLEVRLLEPLQDYPDSVFVEDVALVFPEGAISLNPGADSRRSEVAHIDPVLNELFPVVLATQSGWVDGGDVLMMNGKVVIGVSDRTDWDGAYALADCLEELGYAATYAETPPGVLHFKTGCSLIDEETVLAVPAMADCPEFSGLRVLQTPAGEEAAANLLRIKDNILIGSHFPKTRELVEACGVPTISLPVREIGKVDAGLSCMSLRWHKAA